MELIGTAFYDKFNLILNKIKNNIFIVKLLD
jgi:hypothetical protein